MIARRGVRATALLPADPVGGGQSTTSARLRVLPANALPLILCCVRDARINHNLRFVSPFRFRLFNPGGLTTSTLGGFYRNGLRTFPVLE
ncbi:hypothetical protein FQR65_LT02221 [Abscondita terminalis]|nr:hypothetical protein FQR65_LT02221 [Abscondita terminalis]